MINERLEYEKKCAQIIKEREEVKKLKDLCTNGLIIDLYEGGHNIICNGGNECIGENGAFRIPNKNIRYCCATNISERNYDFSKINSCPYRHKE